MLHIYMTIGCRGSPVDPESGRLVHYEIPRHDLKASHSHHGMGMGISAARTCLMDETSGASESHNCCNIRGLSVRAIPRACYTIRSG